MDITEYKNISYSLPEFIRLKHGNSKKAFAAYMGVKPQQVSEWINKGFIISSGVLYSPRRPIGLTGDAE